MKGKEKRPRDLVGEATAFLLVVVSVRNTHLHEVESLVELLQRPLNVGFEDFLAGNFDEVLTELRGDAVDGNVAAGPQELSRAQTGLLSSGPDRLRRPPLPKMNR